MNGLYQGLKEGQVNGNYQGLDGGLTVGMFENDAINYDEDARLFITCANLSNNTQKIAINNLVKGLKAGNLWSKFKAIYPIVGANYLSHGINLKDPTIEPQPADLVGTSSKHARFYPTPPETYFSGQWRHNENGAKSIGTLGQAWGYPFFKPNDFPQNDVHVSYYSRTDTLIAGLDMGQTDANYFAFFIRYTGNQFLGVLNGASFASFSNTSGTGFYILSRTASNVFKVYKNHELKANTSIISTTPETQQMYINGAYRASSGTLPILPTDREFCFISLGYGLNDEQAKYFNQIVQQFQITLGRQKL